MSPRKEVLSVLLGYLTSQKSGLDKLFQEISGTSASNVEKTTRLAYLLHNLYCALEDLFQEIAKSFENRVEDPGKYHRELLKRMSIEIPGIRPKLLSEKSLVLLDELRGFRHIFRHAYDYELSPEKVGALKKKMMAGWRSVENDLETFSHFLTTAAKSK